MAFGEGPALPPPPPPPSASIAPHALSNTALAASNAAYGRPVYWLPDPPTAETIAAELGRIATKLLADTGVSIVRVRLWETPNGSAEWTPEPERT